MIRKQPWSDPREEWSRQNTESLWEILETTTIISIKGWLLPSFFRRTHCEMHNAILLWKLLSKPLVPFPLPDTFHYWHRRGSELVTQLVRQKEHTVMQAGGWKALGHRLSGWWWKWASLAEAQDTCGMQPVDLSSSASGVYTTNLAQFAWSHSPSVLGLFLALQMSLLP